MRVSVDSNAWERIFDATDVACAPIRASLARGSMEGFSCATGFRIEAIQKRERTRYFSEPYMHVQTGLALHEGQLCFKMSIGPDNGRHPGLPSIQREKLHRALSVGVRLMYGCNWMGLPEPIELDHNIFVTETIEERHEREQRMLDVTAQINARGVGKAAFDAAGGWAALEATPANLKTFSRACSEWADGELVASHTAYRNDVLCTNDRAGNAGKSIFDADNRTWLADNFGVLFKSVDELLAIIGP